jgi:hypothetical protein
VISVSLNNILVKEIYIHSMENLPIFVNISGK